MSPEQISGRATDPRTDIFSFGCVLYEMISGRRAFGGESVAEITTAILRDEPPTLADSGRVVPVELDRVIMRCHEKKPEQRIQSARDLSFALRDLLSDGVRSKPAVAVHKRRTAHASSGRVLHRQERDHRQQLPRRVPLLCQQWSTEQSRPNGHRLVVRLLLTNDHCSRAVAHPTVPPRREPCRRLEGAPSGARECSATDSRRTSGCPHHRCAMDGLPGGFQRPERRSSRLPFNVNVSRFGTVSLGRAMADRGWRMYRARCRMFDVGWRM